MFTSVLVANRGEIACRIFRTAKRMGIQTVAVYSDADAKAKHVREADRAVRLGPAPALESYLRGDLILAAAKETGAQAIHPGYGFLSENPAFAEAVVEAGLIWIGPTPAAIRAMGLKDEAKRLATAAGVPVLEGYQGEDQSEKRLLRAAKDIGFPVLIKAVAGGGGRGIREVSRAEDFKDQLVSAQREAQAAFGNDAVLIERLVQRPRHIEVQVFGDKHGEVVHLFERDCSLQRRRQKVIEEAPAPGMTHEVRAAMTEAALKLAKAVAYENAGTVEFIVDGAGPLRPDGFWFLEMNTRLQVEHPVTEMVTGQDLVEWQFRVAAGEKLPKRQNQLVITGHAVEARVCAEDPSAGFRPSVGRLKRLKLPGPARVDQGFDEGDTVPNAYDSLIAKVIAAQDAPVQPGLLSVGSAPCKDARPAAIANLMDALAKIEAFGVTLNAGFLRRCLALPAFQDGAVHTGLMAENLDSLIEDGRETDLACALLTMRLADQAEGVGPWDAVDGWRANRPPRPLWVFASQDGLSRRVTLSKTGPLQVAEIGSIKAERDQDEATSSFVRARVDGALVFASVNPDEGVVFMNGRTFLFSPPGAAAELHPGEAGDEVKAPLPGRITAVAAKAGQRVKKGDVVLSLEAMKMEHVLQAPRDGVIAAVAAEEGAQIKEGAVLVRLEPLG